MKRSKEIPADLIATSSKLSPRFPNVINEESNTASGNARGTRAAVWYQVNSRMIPVLNPFPTKSSIHNQKNCMTKTNSVIKNVATNGPMKAFTINMSSFLINQKILDCRIQIVDCRDNYQIGDLRTNMDMEPKIQLSSFEMDLLNNSEWILTKNTIVKKAQRLLEQVQGNIYDHTKLNPGVFPTEVITISPKISKGENYLGLPWLMLDYPRYFDKENIFAIRTMFWWGNFFSTTLHLSGKYQQKYGDMIKRAYDDFRKNDFFICVHEEQWHHHLEQENYAPVKNFSLDDFARHIEKMTFVKLARKLSFSEWNNAVKQLTENFVRISDWLG